MNDIDIYNNSKIVLERKNPKNIISWITILIIFTVLFLLISVFYKYNKYEIYYGNSYKEGEKYYIQLYLEDSKIYNFQNDNIIIEGENTLYNIVNISDQYYDIGLNKLFKSITIEPINPKIWDKKIIKIIHEYDKTTFFKTIVNNIRKGEKS